MENLCPGCCSGDYYLLADGRRQCKVCRRKYSSGRRKRKLPAEVLCRILEGFWDTVPAETIAKELQINRKTVQKIYGEFRGVLAESNRRKKESLVVETAEVRHGFALDAGWLRAGEVPMFYLVECSEGVVMFLPGEFDSYRDSVGDHMPPVILVYRRSPGGLQLEQEDVFRRRLGEHDSAERCIECLEFMLEMMKPYRGIPGDKTQLYIEEMLYRYNCRSREEAYRYLQTATLEDCGNIVN